MPKNDSGSWRINRQVNVSVFIQLLILASLIVGSWVNLQTQLDMLARDVGRLLEANRQFQRKLETLWERQVACEYRLRAVEKDLCLKGTEKGL